MWLHLDGINYRADVWLNGRQVADAKSVVGMFRRFRFDVSSFVVEDGPQRAGRAHPSAGLPRRPDARAAWRAARLLWPQRRRRRHPPQRDAVLQHRLGLDRRGPRPQHGPLAARLAGSDRSGGGPRSGGDDRRASARRRRGGRYGPLPTRQSRRPRDAERGTFGADRPRRIRRQNRSSSRTKATAAAARPDRSRAEAAGLSRAGAAASRGCGGR